METQIDPLKHRSSVLLRRDPYCGVFALSRRREHLQNRRMHRAHKSKLESNCANHQRAQFHSDEYTLTSLLARYREIDVSNFTRPSYKPMEKDSTSGASAGGSGGIINMGLTCYGNAVIQCFRHCSRIPWIFQEGRYNTLFKKDPKEKRALQQDLTSAFASVIQLLQKCKEGESVRPAELWRSMRPVVSDTCFEHLATKAPHDSHEFFLFLLDTLHKAMGQIVEMNILRENPKTDQEKHIIGALEVWKREFSNIYSPLVDMFYGLSHVQVECQSCKAVSHRWETFTSLKAAMPQGVTSLSDMLKAEAEPEMIEGYHCEKCEPTRTVAKKTVHLWRVPQVLVVVLKRFTPDGRKIYTRLEPVGATDFSPYFSSESPEREGKTNYSLRGIVDHHGGPRGGHYTAQCKHLGTDAWHLYDDETVHKLPSPMFGESTYMLFFER